MMDDSISRQGAIDSIESHLRIATEPYQLTLKDKIMNHAFEIAISCVYTLPSVPERKKGKWIGTDTKFGIRLYHCSECKADLMQLSLTNFCPNCGIKMEGEA